MNNLSVPDRGILFSYLLTSRICFGFRHIRFSDRKDYIILVDSEQRKNKGALEFTSGDSDFFRNFGLR